MNTDENLQETLNLEYINFGSYGRIAENYGVSKGLIYKIIKYGHTPTKPNIRKRLNLPELKMVTSCLKCGEIHSKKRCSSGNHKKRNRLSINLDNPGSAARSIMKHMNLDSIAAMIEMLMEEKIDVLREG